MPDVHLGKGVTVRTAIRLNPLYSFAMHRSQGMESILSEHVWPSLHAIAVTNLGVTADRDSVC